MMVWGDIGYTSLSPVVPTDGSLNRRYYIFVVFRPVALHFFLALRNATFQQDNALPHAANIVRTFLDTENISYSP